MEVRGRPLHFGVQLQAQRTSWADYAAAVKAVEQLGYGSVWNFDHLLPFSGADDGACFETLTTLSAMALLTERVRIGSLVNGVLYRDPATLAKAAAQVDEMSGGRLDFSLGAAWAEREFKAYGIDFPPLEERHARLDEALEIVKLLWSQPRTTFHGRYYRIEDAPCEPKPVQSPHPPITVGGMGLATVRLVAKHATRFNMIGSPEKCADRIQKLERFCAEIGRDPAGIEFSLHPNVAVAASRARSRSPGRPGRRRQRRSTWTANRASWVIGDPADVTAALRQYIDLGINHFVFAFGYPFDMAVLAASCGRRSSSAWAEGDIVAAQQLAGKCGAVAPRRRDRPVLRRAVPRDAGTGQIFTGPRAVSRTSEPATSRSSAQHPGDDRRRCALRQGRAGRSSRGRKRPCSSLAPPRRSSSPPSGLRPDLHLLGSDQHGHRARVASPKVGADLEPAEGGGHELAVEDAFDQVGVTDEAGQLAVDGIGVDVLRRPELGDGAIADDGHLVGKRQRLVLVVGDQDRGRPRGTQDGVHIGPHGGPEVGVEGGERLVEQDDLGLDGEGAGEGHPLLLAAR